MPVVLVRYLNDSKEVSKIFLSLSPNLLSHLVLKALLPCSTELLSFSILQIFNVGKISINTSLQSHFEFSFRVFEQTLEESCHTLILSG